MILTLSRQEMLEQWRRLALLEPLAPAGAAATLADYSGLDQAAETAMRAWYLDLLDHGPLEMVDTGDVSSLLTAESAAAPAVMRAHRRLRRLTALKMAGWKRPAAPLPADHPAICAARNHYRRGGPLNPLITFDDGRLTIYTPFEGAPIPLVAEGVAEPADPDTYILDERAFALIKPYNPLA